MDQNKSVSTLKGIGEKTEKLFQKVGVFTLGDLLSYYPRAYDEYEEPVPVKELTVDETAAAAGVLKRSAEVKRTGRLQVVTTTLQDVDGDTLSLTWFNMPFLQKTLRRGSFYIFRGRVVNKKGRLTMEQPEIYTPAAYEEKLHELQPIYGLTAGLSNNMVVKAVRQIMDNWQEMRDYLPGALRLRYELAEYNFALPSIHFPKNMEDLIKARKRLVFDEFYLFILALRKLKDEKEATINSFPMEKQGDALRLKEQLPYSLTKAQEKVFEEIRKDLTGEFAMARLIQGDVGSGKTIIAVLACVMAAENGYQSALMVPTEVLARQHYESMLELFDAYDIPYRPILLTGSMTAKEKRQAYEKIECGYSHIVIGTHALIQDRVTYRNLGLVITDEQHRFGVKQRESLSGKGEEPHVLVMSATPIPRTLAIIIYGDLDISVIDELPANRLPIKNCVVNTGYRKTAYDFIGKEVKKGRQAYVICPMVEESEAMEAENVMDYTEKIRSELPDSVKVEYLHGKMKQAEKNRIMEAFASNEIHVLVSTTVVEVGVNVPNATVMMVENAERFGLAQLHQLRGRVGRGKHQSYCIFVNASQNKHIQKRLEILNKSNDGFYIAEEDLKLRGPGDLFGLKQSGLLEFRIGDVFNDASVLKAASDAAGEVLRNDPDMLKPEHQELKKKLELYMKRSLGTVNL